jgi:hypothetical protein
MDTLTPINEVVSVPGSISGSAIIDDLCVRLAEKLSRDCSLRPIDCYRGYSATIVVTLQLHDVYPVEVSAQIAVGTIDARQPSTQIATDVPVVAAVLESPNLERFIDTSGAPEAEAPAPQRRQYVSRIRGAK